MSSQERQYQHFVPQFLLRNFEHPFVCPRSPNPSSKCKKHRHEKGKYPNDMVVNCLQLVPEGFRIDEQPPKRVCGLDDMYTNWAPGAKFPRELETKFGQLEERASQVIKHIIVSHQRGKDKVKLNRTQQTTLRKFVYLQKQRGSGFYKKYNCKSVDDYDINDRALLKDFMERKNIHQPIDVWLHALSSIIDLNMNVNGDWRKSLKSTIYYSIAHDFEEHITAYWMSFCTLSDTNEEFILTDTAYMVNEGPVDDYQDAETGEWLQRGLRFHTFAPVSPKLMIVLRSKHLPEPLEDSNPERKADRAMWRQIEVDFNYGPGKTSILEDLPVHKALNNYSEIVDGRWVMRADWDQKLRQSDTFEFPFFAISTQHGRIINGLLLDHAFEGSTIIFNRKGPFLDLLEWFLTEPCNVGKRIGGEKQQDQERYIERLTEFVRGEGLDITVNTTLRPTWHHLNIEKYRNRNIAAARWLEELEKDHGHAEPDAAKQGDAPTNRPDPDIEGVDSLAYAAVRWIDSLGEQNVEMEPITHQYESFVETTAGQSSGDNSIAELEFRSGDIKQQSFLEPTSKYGDGSREDAIIAEIYRLTTPQWQPTSFRPELLSTRGIKDNVVEEAEVMLRVWLINAILDERKDIAATNRLRRLLERYQLRQENTTFCLFLKAFRYCIWRHEHAVATTSTLSEEWDWKGPEDEVLEARPKLGTFALNIKMWKAMTHDIADKHGLGMEISLAELTSLCSTRSKDRQKRELSAKETTTDTTPLKVRILFASILYLSIGLTFIAAVFVVQWVLWVLSIMDYFLVLLFSKLLNLYFIVTGKETD